MARWLNCLAMVVGLAGVVFACGGAFLWYEYAYLTATIEAPVVEVHPKERLLIVAIGGGRWDSWPVRVSWYHFAGDVRPGDVVSVAHIPGNPDWSRLRMGLARVPLTGVGLAVLLAAVGVAGLAYKRSSSRAAPLGGTWHEMSLVWPGAKTPLILPKVCVICSGDGDCREPIRSSVLVGRRFVETEVPIPLCGSCAADVAVSDQAVRLIVFFGTIGAYFLLWLLTRDLMGLLTLKFWTQFWVLFVPGWIILMVFIAWGSSLVGGGGAPVRGVLRVAATPGGITLCFRDKSMALAVLRLNRPGQTANAAELPATIIRVLLDELTRLDAEWSKDVQAAERAARLVESATG